jgi:hypothetical protein
MKASEARELIALEFKDEIERELDDIYHAIKLVAGTTGQYNTNWECTRSKVVPALIKRLTEDGYTVKQDVTYGRPVRVFLIISWK